MAAARDELPPIDITAIKPGDVVTTFNGVGRYAEPDSDRCVVSSIDETGVELDRETDPRITNHYSNRHRSRSAYRKGLSFRVPI